MSPVMRAYGMADAGVLCVPILGDGALGICATLSVSGVSTHGGAGSPKQLCW